jgi:DNA helicase II / ATP-dependent DNA helicase PcrA
MPDLMGSLNPEQIKAVRQTRGPVLVLAGAGSGKTKALTYRMAYLIKEQKVASHQILAITFTNKAAEEMRIRVKHIIGTRSDKQLFISTFHSFCARALRREAQHLGYAPSFSILDADDQLTAVKQAMEKLQLDPKKIVPEAVRAHISSAKNELIDEDEYAKMANGAFQQAVAKIYRAYQDILRRNQAMDFDDLLMNLVMIFQQQPTILQKYQTQFQYILVDEYQDTNTAQYRLTQLLADVHRNLFVVGDDWQSIYSWRGANFRNILNFHQDYPDACIIKLEQNYRSTQTILDAAHAVIAPNRQRSDKKLWTKQAGGELVTVHEATNQLAEGDFIIREIMARRGAGAKLNDCVILYRTNAQSRALEETMLRAGMPYRVIGGVRFYERKEIKDIVAFLKLLVNPNDNLALGRVINLPTRGIGKKTWQTLEQTALTADLGIYPYLQQQTDLAPPLQAFVELMMKLEHAHLHQTLSQLLDTVLAQTGYRTMLTSEGIEGETRLENIVELKSVMEKYDHLPPGEALATFLEEVALIADTDNLTTADDAVTMMTLHTAKGLEFDYVFIAGAEENIFPHSRSLFDAEELEEERRLCYVGITRARKKVYVTHVTERLLYGNLQHNPRSRFVDDLPEELVEIVRHAVSSSGQTPLSRRATSRLQPGVKVIHDQFGAGVVISQTGDILTVAFARAGIKTLSSELAPLKVQA